MKFKDFQISMGPGLGMDRERLVNLAAFPVYEAIRLWIRSRKLVAPFEKIALRIVDKHSEALSPYFLRARNAIGICQMEVPVDLKDAVEPFPNYRLYISCALTALNAIREQMNWRCDELDHFVRDVLPEQNPPCNHLFEELVKVDAAGTRWEVWFKSEYEKSAVVVIARRGEQVIAERVVASEPGPLYLEDRFPIAKTAVKHGELCLMDKRGTSLAKVALAA